MSDTIDTHMPDVAPQCENGMIFLMDARTLAGVAMEQACGWCVHVGDQCCRDCRCDALDVLLLWLVCVGDND